MYRCQKVLLITCTEWLSSPCYLTKNLLPISRYQKGKHWTRIGKKSQTWMRFRGSIRWRWLHSSGSFLFHRCIKVALVHDMCEAVVGDITPYCGVSVEDKHRREKVYPQKLFVWSWCLVMHDPQSILCRLLWLKCVTIWRRMWRTKYWICMR